MGQGIAAKNGQLYIVSEMCFAKSTARIFPVATFDLPKIGYSRGGY